MKVLSLRPRPGFGLLLLFVSWAACADDPRLWIERMDYALEYLNYEGTLVQLHGSDVSVMRIAHRVDNGVATERITALDEVGREIIRQGEKMTCILPDQRMVLVERREDRPDLASPLRRQFGAGLRFTEGLYLLTLTDGGRLVGRDTRLVTVAPTDNFRYGYRLWLDLATALALKVQIVGERGDVVEQILFSEIEIPGLIPESSVQPTLSTENFTWRRPAERPAGAVDPEVMTPTWHAESLPPGFDLRAARIKKGATTTAGDAAGDGGPLHQLVFSDGVTSVSVFIEGDPRQTDGGEGESEREREGLSRLGAANIYTTVQAGHLVTAMGEAPARTVELIARSMRQSAARPDAARNR